MKGKRFYNLLDDASAKCINEVLSSAVLNFATSNSASASSSTTIQEPIIPRRSSTIKEIVIAKKSRRKLLVTGYLKKISRSTVTSCILDTVAECGTDNDAITTKIITTTVYYCLLFQQSSICNCWYFMFYTK